MFKILVVEDLADNRELLRDILQLGEYEVLEASDGAQALEVARRERPDLILMDISLPLMDGFSVTRLIKHDPALAGIRVVFVSAHAMDKERQLAEEAGGDGYITKPINVHEFTEQVQAYLLDKANPASSFPNQDGGQFTVG